VFWGTVLKFFLPGSIIYFCLLILLQIPSFIAALPALVTIFPYLVLIVGLFLGWRFSRSRLIFILIILAMVDRALRQLTFQPQAGIEIDRIVFNILSFLLPLNILIIAFIRERGILTLRGMGRLGLLGIQPFIIYTLVKFRYLEFFTFLDSELISSTFFKEVAIPQPSMLLFVVVFIFLIFNFIIKKDFFEGGLFWTLLCMFSALLEEGASDVAIMYLSTAGLILIVSILEYSHNVAYRDELTGLPSRRSLSETFLKLPNRYSIAMLDIDNFKKFNDRYGHDVGDQVLRMVAFQILKVSGGGKAFRYGGEEFTIVFPGKTATETRQHLECLRKTIANNLFVIRSPKRPINKPKDLESAPRSSKRVKITVSIGVAERGENLTEPDDVLKAADQALLRAKKAGRDQVRIYGKLHTRER
jgi:diguanylate cyclase (GGDEF)-like protein